MAAGDSVTPTTTLEAISAILEEDLTGAVPSSTPNLDSFYQKLSTTAMGVTSAGIGRDFKVLHPFKQGVAGTIKWVSGVGGPEALGNLQQTVARTASSTHVTAYPGLAENVVPGHATKTIDLARAQGNIFLPIEYMKADKLSAAMMSSIREIIVGAAENIMLSEIHQFYRITHASGDQGIAAIGTSAPTYSNANATDDKATFVVASGSIRNFYPGMFIEFYSGAGARRATTSPVVIDQVRYLPDTTNDTGGWGQIVAVSTGGQDLSGLSIAGGDIIVRLDSEGNGPLGPEDWLSTDGTDIFGINLTVHQQFQSIVQAVNGVLTEPVLNRYLGRFFHAYGLQNMGDSIVTSIGVTNAHVEQNDGLARFARNGQPLVLAEGFDFGEVPFRFLGRNFGWDVSAYMPSSSSMTAATQTGGRAWVLKTRDQNLMRYVPPMRGDTGGGDPIPREVEFVMPLGGPMGFFKPRHDGSGDTVNFLEAPFDRWLAIAPKFIPGVVLTGLTESI